MSLSQYKLDLNKSAGSKNFKDPLAKKMYINLVKQHHGDVSKYPFANHVTKELINAAENNNIKLLNNINDWHHNIYLKKQHSQTEQPNFRPQDPYFLEADKIKGIGESMKKIGKVGRHFG